MSLSLDVSLLGALRDSYSGVERRRREAQEELNSPAKSNTRRLAKWTVEFKRVRFVMKFFPFSLRDFLIPIVLTTAVFCFLFFWPPAAFTSTEGDTQKQIHSEKLTNAQDTRPTGHRRCGLRIILSRGALEPRL